MVSLVITPPSNVLTPMPQVVQCLLLAPSSQTNKTLSLHLRQTIIHIALHN